MLQILNQSVSVLIFATKSGVTDDTFAAKMAEFTAEW